MLLENVNISCDLSHDQLIARLQFFYEEILRIQQMAINEENHVIKETITNLLEDYEEVFDSIIYLH